MNNLTERITALQSLKNIGLDIHFFNTLVDKVLINGGFTIDLNGKEPEHNKRYVVSIPNHESKHYDLSSESILQALLHYVYFKQGPLQHPNYYLGAWVENGVLILDISEAFSDRYKESVIIEIAKDREQRAYYDLFSKETVFVK